MPKPSDHLPGQTMYRVRFQPTQVAIEVPRGTTVAEAARQASLPIVLPCGGQGRCLNCRVRIMAGQVPVTDGDLQAFTQEELHSGFRLACRAVINQDVEVQFTVGAAAGKEAPGRERVQKPLFHVLRAAVPEPTLTLQHSDAERLRAALGTQRRPTVDALRQLGSLVRTDAPTDLFAAVTGDTILALGRTEEFFGLAIDIGTTTVAASLVDLTNGDTAASASAWNRQAAYGADVVSRIQFASASHESTEKLTGAVGESLCEIVGEVCRAATVDPDRVIAATVAGNPTMAHLFLGLPPRGLARAPYVGVTSEEVVLSARHAGLPILPSAPVTVLPGIASNVGGDVVADLLVAPPATANRCFLLIDLGTNAEIVAGTPEGLYACSTAAGPAFEGATITHGMRAGPGAIDRVAWTPETGLTVHVIGETDPRGFCGSGLFDVLAVLLNAGIVDSSGRLLPPDELPPELPASLRSAVADNEGRPSFVVAGVELTTADVRELQLAKGAVQAGITALIGEAGCGEGDVDEVYLAGAFGNFIQPGSARRVGLVPPSVKRLVPLGNAAVRGARLALLCGEAQARACSLASEVRYVELATNARWRDSFAEAMFFPE